MADTARTEIYDVDINKFYETITDYETYPEFVDGVSEIEVLEKDDNGARIKYHINIIKEFTYILKMTHTAPNKVSWEFESGDLFKSNFGSWELVDLGDGQIEVTYALDVNFKMMVPKMITNKLVKNNLPTMMQSVFERAKRK